MEITKEEEEILIRTVAENIHKHGLDLAALLFLESTKPLSYLGSQMGYVFLSPFFPALGESLGSQSEKLLQIMEKRRNVDRLIDIIEEMREEKFQELETEEKKRQAKIESDTDETKTRKKGWRRFFPFL